MELLGERHDPIGNEGVEDMIQLLWVHVGYKYFDWGAEGKQTSVLRYTRTKNGSNVLQWNLLA